MVLDTQQFYVARLGILGLAFMAIGSCSGAGRASQDVRADMQDADMVAADDSPEGDTHSPPGVFGCLEEGAHPTTDECECLVDFSSSVLLHVSNAPTGWNDWPDGLALYDGFSRVQWTVAIAGGEEHLLLDEPLRVDDAERAVHRTVRLAGTGEALISLRLLDLNGEVAAEGRWERSLMPGEMWFLAWAWDCGSAWEEVMGAGKWFRFEPKVPYCPPETPDCFNLWIYSYSQNPITDECGVLDRLVIQPWYGQSIEATAGMIEQLFGCCESFELDWSPNGPSINLSIPKPSMYMGAIFHVACAAESGLPLIQAQTLTTCLY